MVRKILLSLVVIMGVTLSGFAQRQQISGKVSDANGESIVGATILVVGTTTGTTTGTDGSFSVAAPKDGAIEVSFIGYETQNVAIAGKSHLNITLSDDAHALEDVIVVAYGTTTKEAFTGSASVVSSEQISKIQSSSVLSALEGTTSGVQITSSTGQPGENPSVLIRGVGSINASKSPLYVVDGATYEGDIAAINSADIESMTVLKDAAASSLYGARGANGVILITTKKGNKSDLGVTFDMKVGVNSRAVSEYDMVTDPGTYYEQTWKGQYNKLYNNGVSTDHDELVSILGGSSSNSLSSILGGYNNYNVDWADLIGSDGKLNSTAKLLYSDDWYNELFNNSIRQEYNLSIGKNQEKQSYYLSLGYLNDESYAKGSGYDRFTGRIRMDRQVTDWFKIGANLSYAHTDQAHSASVSSTAYRNYFMWTRGIAPIYPVYLHDPTTGDFILDDNGSKIYDYGNSSEYGYLRPYAASSNPAGVLEYDTLGTVSDNIIGSTFVEFKIIDGLKLTGNFDTNIAYATTTEMYNPTYGDAVSYNGRIASERTVRNSYTASSFLNYYKEFGDLSIDVLAGTETYNKTYQYFYGEKRNLASTDTYPDFSNAVQISELTGYTYGYSVLGLLSRVNLNYADKYYLSGSFRRDASSKFHPDNRWGNFGSVGASWRVDQEDFMDSVSWIDALKVKASYGSQGNDSLLDDDGYELYIPYMDHYEIVNNNDEVSLKQTYVGNENITWEKNHNFNVGFDATVFDRFTFGVEYFSRLTTDMLFNMPVALSTGVASIPENLGKMKNYGVEAMVNVDIIKTKDLYWGASLNLTHVKNKILELPEEYKEDGLAATGYKIMKEGGSIYDFYLPEFAGIDETGSATWNLYDSDGEFTGTTTVASNAYTTESRTLQGTALPDLQGGFSTTVSYKGFDFSAIFSYQIGGQVYDTVYASTMQMSDYGNGMHKDMLNAWTSDNTDTDVPMLVWGTQDANAVSNYFLTDASYLNIRNITLGYTLPKQAFGNTGISSLRVYLAGDNLALFSARKGLDPRQYASGTTTYSYSPIRTVSVGVNLTL